MGAAAEIRAVLAPGAIVPVFQPIVRIADGYVVGYEALARFPGAAVERSPHEWFVLAESCGLRVELEVACWRAIAAQGPPPGDAMLFVNTSPVALVDHRLDAVRAELPERLVVELTEQDAVHDYELLRTKLQAWSNDGVRLAIDDTGAGYSSLQHVLQLAPDFLKLDRSMIAGVDRERSRRVLVRSLVAFAREVGAAVIAECVERPEELEVLAEAGVALAQGWLLSRPGPPWPLPSIQHPVTRPERPMPAIMSDDEEARFRHALAQASTHAEAAEAVCGHLHRLGQLMPSVYILRDGLLRCLAQCGYWQIMDGFPPGVGVLSQVLVTRETVAVREVGEVDEFLEAAPGVMAELAVPLFVGGEVTGGLNVESLSPLTASAEREIERSATLLSARMEQLGPEVPSSPLARLARSSKHLAGLVELDEVRSAVVAMACEVSGMNSALLAQCDNAGNLEIMATRGPLARAFLAMPAADVDRLAAMVDRVSSCYTAGDLTGRPVAGTETLRAAGASEVAVLPLVSLGRRTGVLVVAHTESMRLSTDEIEPLELLAVEAARSLDLAATVAAWRERATRDPLTGLQNHSAFHEALMFEARPYAVAIMDIDRFKSVNDTAGHLTGDRLLREAAATMNESLQELGRAYRIGGDEFAAILPGLELEAAELAGRRLCRSVAKVLTPYNASISVGVTVAQPGEATHEFVDRADRLLYAAKRSGSGRVNAA
jgi:diguanylate cyclase (GGDEF)-like protein